MLVTFPQRKTPCGPTHLFKDVSRGNISSTENIAGKPIYSKTCLGWEYLRSNISSTVTRSGQTHSFIDVSRVGNTSWANLFIQKRVWGGRISVEHFLNKSTLRANPFIQRRGWGESTSVVTFPQRKHVAGKPIYSKTCPGWEYLRSTISSMETRCGHTNLFEDASGVAVHP